MSTYRCGICEELKDEEIHECIEHPFEEFSCICLECDLKLIEHSESHNNFKRT